MYLALVSSVSFVYDSSISYKLSVSFAYVSGICNMFSVSLSVSFVYVSAVTKMLSVSFVSTCYLPTLHAKISVKVKRK